MCATIRKQLEDSDENILSVDNIHVITWYSSVEWKEQTKFRLHVGLAARAFHRSDLTKMFTDEIKNKPNFLIIMDENQIASMKEQRINTTFRYSSLLGKQRLYERDVKLVEYSATPDGTIYYLMYWNENGNQIFKENYRG